MIYEEINLKEIFPMLKYDCILTAYCNSGYVAQPKVRLRRTILLFPAGGYRFVSRRENDPIALKLVGEGINVFTLKYKVVPFEYPYPLIEAYAALAYININADKYFVDREHIGVMGFSAGGHLAASLSCYFRNDEFANELKIDKKIIKLSGCLLGYAVISMEEYSENETRVNITQNRVDLLDFFSIEKHITKDFPPTFIWTTAEDMVVHPINSIDLARELQLNNVLYELHIYPKGYHGLSLANDVVFTSEFDNETLSEYGYNSSWIEHAVHFIKNYM